MNTYSNQSYEIIGLVIIAILCIAPVALLILAVLDWIRSRISHTQRRKWLFYTAIATDIIFTACMIDAFFVEPRLLTVTRINLESPGIQSITSEIKIIHISDIHFEKSTALIAKLLATISREHPDLICVTGDIYQAGEYDTAGFASFMAKLCDIAPICFVCGYDDETVISGASSGRAHYVDARSLQIGIRNTKVQIAGMQDSSISRVLPSYNTGSNFKIMLSHTPDTLDEASLTNADLFLAGHTHGGQIRLPFWGAVITNCKTGKKYEYGLYKKGHLRAFVTRGIGMEPKPAPQARFLCPPEVVVINVR